MGLATGAVNRDKSEKSFSLFSVVTFPNNECTTTGNTPMTGVCQTTEECSNNKGAASGNCASGFGVCCMYTTSTCGDTITNNVTYIQNTNYPSGFSTASKACAYKVTGDASVCQIRLDFDNGVLAQPDANGICLDTVAVTSPSGYNPPTICGTLTGQHMYIETARQNPGATININTGVAISARTWKVKVTMIECSNPSRAPTDCLQYFTGTGGIVESFNNPTLMIKNQRYDVCIRQIDGFCTYEVAEANSGTPDAFDLEPVGGDDVAKVGVDCDVSWVVIPTSDTSDKHCGRKLNSISAQTVSGTVVGNVNPFVIGVVASNVNQENGKGFKLRYTQRPCNN
jgi:hypothetical protein